MVKKLLPAVLLMTFCFWSTGAAFAESVVVEDDKIFIADGGLQVLNLDDKLPADCLKDLVLVDVVGATDVFIADGKAIVTVDDAGSVGVVIVDVSSCLSDVFEVEECFATVDLATGILEIPCVEVDGVVYTIKMDQRGNSMNWEVTFADKSEELLNYRRKGADGDGS
jgi:hypothetical protein